MRQAAPKHLAPPSRRAVTIRSLVLAGLAVSCVVATNRRAGAPSLALGVYGTLAVSYLVAKLALAAAYKPWRTRPPRLSLAVVVPFFNEDTDALRACIDSIICQTRPPDELWVIDDGSTTTAGAEAARRALYYGYGGPAGQGVVRILLRSDRNGGKRDAQSVAFRDTRCDLIMTVDSDAVLDRDCIAEALRPFADRRVQAVCCVAQVLNHRRNMLTRLIDLRYSTAFLFERAAYTVADSMLCATGVASIYRRAVIQDHLRDYLNQRFLGRRVALGDDRRLTNYALTKGRVVLQDTAVARTLAPESFRHFLRQQVRWNRSFFRETLWALRHIPSTRIAWWLGLAEISLWLAFSATMTSAFVVAPLLGGQVVSVYYVAYIVTMAYARSARHAARSRLAYALAPVYGLLHLLILTPVRIWALLTLRRNDWGTRQDGPEVALERPAVPFAA